MHVVILTDRKESLFEFAQGLGGDVEWATAADDVLSRAKTPPWQLVVVDAMMPGMKYTTFLMGLLRVNAMLNTVVVTDMDEAAFHEDSEGSGRALHRAGESRSRERNQGHGQALPSAGPGIIFGFFVKTKKGAILRDRPLYYLKMGV